MAERQRTGQGRMMKTRKLRDIEVSEVGMGCMAFSHGYGKIPSEEYSIEAILMDIRMTFMDGMTAARRVREKDGEVAIVFITNTPQYGKHVISRAR